MLDKTYHINKEITLGRWTNELQTQPTNVALQIGSQTSLFSSHNSVSKSLLHNNLISKEKHMATQNAILKNTLILFLFTLAVMAKTVFSQDCQKTGCPGLKECCSLWGYCGAKDDHCGFWCFGGPCNLKNKSYGFDYNVNSGPRGPIESIVTPELFNHIMSKAGSNCSAKGFYTHKASSPRLNRLEPIKERWLSVRSQPYWLIFLTDLPVSSLY